MWREAGSEPGLREGEANVLEVVVGRVVSGRVRGVGASLLLGGGLTPAPREVILRIGVAFVGAVKVPAESEVILCGRVTDGFLL